MTWCRWEHPCHKSCTARTLTSGPPRFRSFQCSRVHWSHSCSVMLGLMMWETRQALGGSLQASMKNDGIATFQAYCYTCSPDSPPELWLGAVCEGQIGLVEGLHSPNVLPVAIVQVCLYVHAHVLGTRDDLTAKVVGLQMAQAHVNELIVTMSHKLAGIRRI